MAIILIVEDVKHIQELLSIEVCEQGHHVIFAATLLDIVKNIETSRANLVIIDSWYITNDVCAILNEIRTVFASLPVIIWTDCKNADIAADYYVLKSYNLTRLKLTIESAIEDK